MSSTPLTVTGTEADRLIVAETVASLPVSFAHGSAGADVTVVPGEREWPARAAEAIDHGARGIIVTSPGAADAQAIEQLAGLSDRERTPVVLAEPYAGNAALPDSADEITGALEGTFTVAARGIAPSATPLREIALSAVRSLRAAGISELSLAPATTGPQSLMLDGTAIAGGARAVAGILVTTTDALAPTVSLRAYGPHSLLEIDLPSPSTARPARVAISGDSGMHVAPTLYESAQRTSWRALSSAIDRSEGSGRFLRGFAEDLRTVRAAIA
jgi:hypothetical protein